MDGWMNGWLSLAVVVDVDPVFDPSFDQTTKAVGPQTQATDRGKLGR